MFVLFKLFFEFFKIGAFSFGGGMATLPYVYEMAEKTNWITIKDVSNILAVSQATPGPLACNIGTVTGMNAQGLLGAIIANIAFVIPAILFMGVCYKMINKIRQSNKANEVIKVIRAGALAMLVTSSITLFKSAFLGESGSVNFLAIIFCIIIFFVMEKKKISTIYLMIISSIVAGCLGL